MSGSEEQEGWGRRGKGREGNKGKEGTMERGERRGGEIIGKRSKGEENGRIT